MTQRVAVIGAGIAGLACARVLRRAGFYVDVFEQQSVIGGRIATNRMGLAAFDSGAQYLSARLERFRHYLDELQAAGYADVWQPAFAEGSGGAASKWYVGTPGMSAIVRPLAEGVRITTGRRVHTIQRVDRASTIWFEDQTSAGPFASIAVCVPCGEARLLLGRYPDIAERIAAVRMSPCWALMVRLDERLPLSADVHSDMSQMIRWVSRNNTKPGRSARGDHLVVHASQAFSRETEDAEPELVAEEMWAEVSHVLNLPPVRPREMVAHLWRHALVDQPLGETFIYARDLNVGVAGDWCLGRLAEHAFESGSQLGKAMLDSLS